MRNRIKIFLKNKYEDLFLIALIIFNIICLGFETDKEIKLISIKTILFIHQSGNIAIFTYNSIVNILI